jgi:hypothetical protein
MPKTKINITKLKNFAYTQLPQDSILREILLLESTEIDTSTFLARLPIWLQLSVPKRGDNK